MSKVEYFYWNKLSRKSFSFESDQFFDLCFVFTVHGGCAENIQYILLLCYQTKGYFPGKLNVFAGRNSAVKAFLSNQSSFLICVLF